MPKHVIIANDLAGMGKVAMLPSMVVMANCQIETSLLPTVILSSHTGGFSDIFVEDYSQKASEFLKQWDEIERPIHGIVTGYVTSDSLVDEIVTFAKQKRLPLLVDPIMGDRGQLYAGFDLRQVQNLKRLAKEAELLLPNLTEAAFLTGRPYLGETYHRADVEALLVALSELGPKQVIITGVSLEEGKLGAAYYHARTGQFSYFAGPASPHHFFGTGDLFTSIVSAFYIQGAPLEEGIKTALDFIEQTIETTLALGRDLKYGLYFEPHLARLIQHITPYLEEKDD